MATPTGRVYFYDSTAAANLGQPALDNSGVATFTTSDLAMGEHQIAAQYYGDSNYRSGNSSPLDQEVDGPTVTVSDATVVEADTASFTVTLSSAVNTPLTISYCTSDGTAVAGTNYMGVSDTSYTIPANTKYASISVRTLFDPQMTDTKTFDVHLTPNWYFGNTSGSVSGTGTIYPIQARLDLYFPDGSLVPASQKQSPGGMMFVGQREELDIVPVTAPVSGGSFVLNISSAATEVYDNSGSRVVGGTTFATTAATVLWVNGVCASSSVGAESFSLGWQSYGSGAGSKYFDSVTTTVVQASLKSIKVESEYRVGGGYNGVFLGINYADNGAPQPCGPGNTDWWPNYPLSGMKFCQAKNTYVTVTASVNIQPQGVPFALVGTGCQISFTYRAPNTSWGADQPVPLRSDDALPNQICDLHDSLDLNVQLSSNPNLSLDLGTMPYEAFVTFAMPIDHFGGNGAVDSVTDMRLAAAIEGANMMATPGGGDQQMKYDAAEGIQHWLTTNAAWGNSTLSILVWGSGDPANYWAQIDGTQNGACNQHAVLHELMLEQLGIPAAVEVVVPTLNPQASAGSLNYFSFGATPSDPLLLWTAGPLATLYFDFRGGPNLWEGGVKVDGQFYPEFSSMQLYCSVVGVPQSADAFGGPAQTAEYNAMMQIAQNVFPRNPNLFQHWGVDQLTGVEWIEEFPEFPDAQIEDAWVPFIP